MLTRLTRPHQHSHNAHQGRSMSARLLVLGTAAVGAMLLGSGVFAAWAPTGTAVSGSLAAANLSVQLVDTNGTTFTAGVSNLLPGDYLNRYVDLTNSGTVAQTFTGSVVGSGTLGGAETVQVDICSVAWSSNGSCSATTTSIQTATTTGSAVGLTFPSLVTSGVQHVRFQFKLLANADQSTYQGTSVTETVTISGSATASGGQDRTAG